MATDSTYQRDQVVEIINSVLKKIHPTQRMPDNNDTLVNDLSDLKDIIEGLRTQLNEIGGHEIGSIHIPSASEELDAVLNTTEEATNNIMNACENILGIIKGAEPDIFNKVENNVVQIFEACTFQDITGQRIQKVSSCLKQIDEKTASILGSQKEEKQDTSETQNGSDDILLNGPALPQNSLSQEDIDKLLADFD